MYNPVRWTSSSLLKWIERQFGVNRLQSGTSCEWKIWTTQYEKTHPYLNTIWNMVDYMQDTLQWPCEKLHDMMYYIRYRYIKKTHLVPTYLPKGKYYDPCDKLICSMFGLLVDFIEIDKAHMQLLCNKNSYKYRSPWYSIHRSKKLGLQYLDWECTLTGENGEQANAAKEQLNLYTWWLEVRPNRIDPYESTGYNEYCDETVWKVWDQDDSIIQSMLRKIRDINNNYSIEDTEMMTRLILIRDHLWT